MFSRIKHIVLGVGLLLLAILIERSLRGDSKMPPEWSRKCTLALVGGAIILLVNAYLIRRFL